MILYYRDYIWNDCVIECRSQLKEREAALWTENTLLKSVIDQQNLYLSQLNIGSD